MPKKQEKMNFDIIANGAGLKDAEKSLEKKIKDMNDTFGVKGMELGREYQVQYFTGDNPSKGGIIGVGESYEEAQKNAREQAPVEITSAYNEKVTIASYYEFNKQETKEAKEKSKGSPAGPQDEYMTRAFKF